MELVDKSSSQAQVQTRPHAELQPQPPTELQPPPPPSYERSVEEDRENKLVRISARLKHEVPQCYTTAPGFEHSRLYDVEKLQQFLREQVGSPYLFVLGVTYKCNFCGLRGETRLHLATTVHCDECDSDYDYCKQCALNADIDTGNCPFCVATTGDESTESTR